MVQTAPNVVVVIGVGSIGLAIARRVAQGRRLLIASHTPTNLSTVASSLVADGHDVSTHDVDIKSYTSVQNLAETASALGNLTAVILTSGISSVTKSTQDVYAVDLIGTANIIDAFLPHVGRGSSVVCLASMSAHAATLSPTLSKHLATAPRESLLDNAELQAYSGGPGTYSVAKQGNILRVQAAAKAYGLKGARINTVSPGLIASKMGTTTMESEYGEVMKKGLEASPISRMGTGEEIANVVEFLIGSGSSFGKSFVHLKGHDVPSLGDVSNQPLFK